MPVEIPWVVAQSILARWGKTLRRSFLPPTFLCEYYSKAGAHTQAYFKHLHTYTHAH